MRGGRLWSTSFPDKTSLCPSSDRPPTDLKWSPVCNQIDGDVERLLIIFSVSCWKSPAFGREDGQCLINRSDQSNRASCRRAENEPLVQSSLNGCPHFLPNDQLTQWDNVTSITASDSLVALLIWQASSPHSSSLISGNRGQRN